MLLKQQLKSSPLQIQIILPNNNASGFYNLLNRPAWYMEHFIPAFDSWRKEHQGIILLAEIRKIFNRDYLCRIESTASGAWGNNTRFWMA